WETGSGHRLTTLQGQAGGVQGVALSANGERLASSSEDGTVWLWETGSGRQLATLRGHIGQVWGVAISANGEQVASGGFDGTVKVWETQSGTCLRTLRPERRYERMDITGLTGITDAQRTALLALGAIDGLSPADGRPPRCGWSRDSKSRLRQTCQRHPPLHPPRDWKHSRFRKLLVRRRSASRAVHTPTR